MKNLIVTAILSASLGALAQWSHDAHIVANTLESSSLNITENVEQASALLAIAKMDAPTFTYFPTGWSLEHVKMPACPDDHKRTVDAPERDEVDALSVYCVAR